VRQRGAAEGCGTATHASGDESTKRLGIDRGLQILARQAQTGERHTVGESAGTDAAAQNQAVT